jgi:hypothetical protein
VVDAETDENGKLSAETEKNYKAEMKHEHGIYRNIKGSLQSMPTGIPATYCSGALHCTYVRKAWKPGPARLMRRCSCNTALFCRHSLYA